MKFSVHMGAKRCYANARDVFPDFEHIDDVIDEVELFLEIRSPDTVWNVEKKHNICWFVSAVILHIWK